MSIANDSPFVSIGLMVHNAEAWLEKTIRSLLDQTHAYFELIISDNASRDKSGDICTEFALKDGRIRYYRNETDIGSFRNSMKVFNSARGEFFMWAGDHDLWAPTFISQCLDVLMKDESVALSYPQTILIDADDTPITAMTDKIDTRGISPIEAYRKILWELEACNMFYGIFRTAVLRKLLPSSMTIGTDIILLGRLSLVGAIAQTREPLFFRRENRNPESVQESTARWVNILIQDNNKLEAKAPWLMMCNSHLENIMSSTLTSTEKRFMISEVVASCSSRFGESIIREHNAIIDNTIQLLHRNRVEQNSVESLDLSRFTHTIRMFYPELEGIDFLLGAVFYINGLTEESTYFARREKAKFPNSSLVGHLLDALGGATACLGSGATANDAHMGIKTSLNQVTAPLVVKLYAGDIPERPEYDGWIGLSLTKSDHRHILHDITNPFHMADNSVDAFQTEDVLEHIQYEKLPAVLNEIFRVLKPGALYRLSVPDYGCDVLRERSVKDVHGNIIFDPGGGGTPEDPGHLWFPRIESVYRMLEKTRFHTEGRMDFLHYWDMNRPTFVMRPIDYSKGFVKRTPDHDERVKAPYRPMSIVIDLYKGEDTINYPITTLGYESFESHISLTKKQQLCAWYYEHNDFVSFRETMQGFSEADFLNADLKLLQDLCVCDFIKKNIFQGAKVLEIGGGNSRILSYFKDYFEGWNLDKFEGIGAGPIGVSETDEYIVVQNYIGNFDQRLPERYFDLVFSISVMEHINDNDSILSKIVQDIDRILKPGGYSVHCIDCRFPPSQNPSIDGRRLAKYIIQQYGLDPQFVLDEHKNPDVYYMSTKAYELYWKKACNNRSHELDGLPFNIFLVKRKSDYNLKGIYGLATDT